MWLFQSNFKSLSNVAAYDLPQQMVGICLGSSAYDILYTKPGGADVLAATSSLLSDGRQQTFSIPRTEAGADAFIDAYRRFVNDINTSLNPIAYSGGAMTNSAALDMVQLDVKTSESAYKVTLSIKSGAESSRDAAMSKWGEHKLNLAASYINEVRSPTDLAYNTQLLILEYLRSLSNPTLSQIKDPGGFETFLVDKLRSEYLLMGVAQEMAEARAKTQASVYYNAAVRTYPKDQATALFEYFPQRLGEFNPNFDLSNPSEVHGRSIYSRIAYGYSQLRAHQESALIEKTDLYTEASNNLLTGSLMGQLRNWESFWNTMRTTSDPAVRQAAFNDLMKLSYEMRVGLMLDEGGQVSTAMMLLVAARMSKNSILGYKVASSDNLQVDFESFFKDMGVDFTLSRDLTSKSYGKPSAQKDIAFFLYLLEGMHTLQQKDLIIPTANSTRASNIVTMPETQRAFSPETYASGYSSSLRKYATGHKPDVDNLSLTVASTTADWGDRLLYALLVPEHERNLAKFHVSREVVEAPSITGISDTKLKNILKDYTYYDASGKSRTISSSDISDAVDISSPTPATPIVIGTKNFALAGFWGEIGYAKLLPLIAAIVAQHPDGTYYDAKEVEAEFGIAFDNGDRGLAVWRNSLHFDLNDLTASSKINVASGASVECPVNYHSLGSLTRMQSDYASLGYFQTDAPLDEYLNSKFFPPGGEAWNISNPNSFSFARDIYGAKRLEIPQNIFDIVKPYIEKGLVTFSIHTTYIYNRPLVSVGGVMQLPPAAPAGFVSVDNWVSEMQNLVPKGSKDLDKLKSGLINVHIGPNGAQVDASAQGATPYYYFVEGSSKK